MIEFKGNLTKDLTSKNYSVNQTGTVVLTKEAMLHAKMLQEFLDWLGRKYTINAWYRTPAYNKSVGGIATSNHLKGTATDITIPSIRPADKFKKYSEKWKSICEKYKVVGEMGLYDWGFHIGSHITYSKKFYTFDNRGK